MGLMQCKIICLALLTLCLVFPKPSNATWSGPTVIGSATWGNGPGQVTLAVGDTIVYDKIPSILGVFGNQAWIADIRNKCYVSFDMAISVWQIHPALERLLPNGWTEWDAQLPPKQGWLPDAQQWTFYQNDAPLTTTTQRPLELGVLKKRSPLDSKAIEFEFDDAIYVCGPTYPNCSLGLPRIGRGANAIFVFTSSGTKVTRSRASTLIESREIQRGGETIPIPVYSTEQQGVITIPQDTHECVDEPLDFTTSVTCHRRTSYGQTPIIGPDGSVYTSKAVYPGNPGAGYYILKWTWMP